MGQSIWLVRHATRVDVVDPAWKDSADRPFDPPLAEQGLGEAERLGEVFARKRVDRVYCSPFIRAIQTAAPIATAARCTVRIEPGLAEWFKAEWFDGVPVLAPQVHPVGFDSVIDRSYQSPVVLTYPETWDQLMARTRDTVTRLAQSADNIVLVGHGASVLGCAAGLLNASSSDETPPIASVYHFTYSGQAWEPQLLADTSHLSPGPAHQP
jgi:broad specificity phosphatase PhoE